MPSAVDTYFITEFSMQFFKSLFSQFLVFFSKRTITTNYYYYYFMRFCSLSLISGFVIIVNYSFSGAEFITPYNISFVYGLTFFSFLA